MKGKILYLDDNLEHLILVKEMLDDDFTVFCTDKAKEAFEILDKEKIHAIIADYNMPEISGIDFFTKIDKSHPLISRVLLTAYSSTNLAVSAFKDANVYEFLTKPIEYEKLVETARNAVKATISKKKKEKKRKKELRLAEMLSTIFENSPNIFLLADKEGIIQKINKKGIELFGINNPTGDILGSSIQCINSFDELICGQNAECKQCILRKSIFESFHTKQNILNREGKMVILKNGEKVEHELLFSTSVLTINKKEFVLVGLVDITENKQLVKTLAKTENRYQKLFENLKPAFALHEIILDDNGLPKDYKFLEVNQAFEVLTGYSKEEILNKNILDVYAATDPDWIRTFGNVALTQKDVHFEYYHKEKETFYEISAYSPEPMLFAVLISEITERKIIEQTLSFTSKRSAIDKNEEFFKESVQFLSVTLGMDHVFITKKGTDPDKATTVASFVDFAFADSGEFCIKGSPCEIIYQNRQAVYQSDVKNHFPNCEFLEKLDAKSYAGYAMINPFNEIIGHIAILGKKEISNPEMVLKVMSLVAVRITSEMELKTYLTEKQGILKKLQKTIKQRDEEIELRKDADKKILGAILTTEENERSNFAREMHDGIGPQLSIINMYLNVLLNSNKNKESVEILEKAINILEEALHSVVEISHAMSPSVLKKNGLAYAIESFCKKIEYENTPKFSLKLDINQRLKYEVEFTLYRVCTELINNSLKYASAKNINIVLQEIENTIYLSYADDGAGFDINNAKSKTSGMGLENIHNRINALKGSVIMHSQPNEGVHFDILVPNYNSN